MPRLGFWEPLLLAAILGCALALFSGACGVVYLRRKWNRFWWALNRVRACIAYEGDPGPWRV